MTPEKREALEAEAAIVRFLLGARMLWDQDVEVLEHALEIVRKAAKS